MPFPRLRQPDGQASSGRARLDVLIAATFMDIMEQILKRKRKPGPKRNRPGDGRFITQSLVRAQWKFRGRPSAGPTTPVPMAPLFRHTRLRNIPVIPIFRHGPVDDLAGPASWRRP